MQRGHRTVARRILDLVPADWLTLVMKRTIVPNPVRVCYFSPTAPLFWFRLEPIRLASTQFRDRKQFRRIIRHDGGYRRPGFLNIQIPARRSRLIRLSQLPFARRFVGDIMFDRMKYRVLLIFALLAGQAAGATPRFVGMWLTCFPENGHAYQYTLLTVAPAGKQFRVTSETGQIFSFSGSGTLVLGELHIRGCHFSRDQPLNGCDPENPPIAFVMKPTEFIHTGLPVLAALRTSKPVYTSSARWKALARQCEDVAAEFLQKQEAVQ